MFDYFLNNFVMRPLVLLLFLINLSLSLSLHSWCDRELCPNGARHIACKNDATFDENCYPDTVLVDIEPYRGEFLHSHNKRRNFIALGLLPGYYPAAKMATMKWDDELAYLATLNLMTCRLDHDDCNNSFRFKNVGQCLSGLYTDRSPHLNVSYMIEKAVGSWFTEYMFIDNSYIRKFRVAPHFDDYGHFAELVIDRNTHVGCAMIRFTRPQYPNIYIVNIACNYATLYAIGVPVYQVGYPASRCKTGTNPSYPALCSLNERFNPNYD